MTCVKGRHNLVQVELFYAEESLRFASVEVWL